MSGLNKNRLYLATIGDRAAELAGQYGFGIEIDEFCHAPNMDIDFERFDGAVRSALSCSDRFVFHAPFMELCPCAVDPLVREIAFKRLMQAGRLCASYGINRMVVHSGFVPRIYYPEWFVDQASAFFRNLLGQLPQNIELLIENVLDPDPRVLSDMVRSIGSDRVGICLDIGHAAVAGDLPVQNWLDVLGTGIRHFHAHDNDGKKDLHMIPGQGNLGYPDLFDAMMSAAPEATITLECTDAEACVAMLHRSGICSE